MQNKLIRAKKEEMPSKPTKTSKGSLPEDY
jgi:hypothetical protein